MIGNTLGQQILSIVAALGIPTLVGVLFNFFNNRKSLAANQPKTDAEVDQINVGTMGTIIDRQDKEIQNLSKKADKAVEKAEEAQRLADERETQMRNAMQKQADDLAAQFQKQLDKVMAESRRESAALKKQNELLTQRNQLLTTHIERITVWVKDNYDAGHPDGIKPPPEFLHFEP